ncbi:BQ2448_4045 [Microbotryum intermedium]|uniref:BQ2448_4045 protein n=1 Tax=Microbotryum intermedium TaxID=269621 RepID=A0A238FMU7_9BASI|nr:BQ2448_4045 [Microbotryum intermedium]
MGHLDTSITTRGASNILHISEPSELDRSDDPWVHIFHFHLTPKKVESSTTLTIDGALRVVMCVRRRNRFELRVVAPGDTSGYILLQPSPTRPPIQILASPATELGKAFLPLIAVASHTSLLVFSPRDEWSCICRMDLRDLEGAGSSALVDPIAWLPFIETADGIQGGLEIGSMEGKPAARLRMLFEERKPLPSGSSLRLVMNISLDIYNDEP